MRGVSNAKRFLFIFPIVFIVFEIIFLLVPSSKPTLTPEFKISDYGSNNVRTYDGMASLHWRFHTNSEPIIAEFALVCNTSGWCAVGFGSSSMQNADIWRGYVDDNTGEVVLQDSWSTHRLNPPPDLQRGGEMEFF